MVIVQSVQSGFACEACSEPATHFSGSMLEDVYTDENGQEWIRLRPQDVQAWCERHAPEGAFRNRGFVIPSSGIRRPLKEKP